MFGRWSTPSLSWNPHVDFFVPEGIVFVTRPVLGALANVSLSFSSPVFVTSSSFCLRSIVEAIRKGTVMALRKTSGGVQGMVVGDGEMIVTYWDRELKPPLLSTSVLSPHVLAASVSPTNPGFH